MNATNCRHLWAGVVAGAPPNDPTLHTGRMGYLVRSSVMETFTQHNPKPCLTADDVEALLTLYPDCDQVRRTPC